MLIITSHDKELKEVQLELDGEYSEVKNMLDDKEITLSGDKLSISVDYADVNIVRVTKWQL